MANYETVKAGIAGRLKALGYTESSQITDFIHASAHEYGNTYILKCLSGEQEVESLYDRFDDRQVWQILIAFERSENNDILQYDKVHRSKDAILKDLDKPANWTSFVKILKYNTWEVTETPNYYVLGIKLSILDIYTY